MGSSRLRGGGSGEGHLSIAIIKDLASTPRKGKSLRGFLCHLKRLRVDVERERRLCGPKSEFFSGLSFPHLQNNWVPSCSRILRFRVTWNTSSGRQGERGGG